jgi:hypothetical protein
VPDKRSDIVRLTAAAQALAAIETPLTNPGRPGRLLRAGRVLVVAHRQDAPVGSLDPDRRWPRIPQEQSRTHSLCVSLRDVTKERIRRDEVGVDDERLAVPLIASATLRARTSVARPEGVGRALATYEILIEGRDEWLAAAKRLA